MLWFLGSEAQTHTVGRVESSSIGHLRSAGWKRGLRTVLARLRIL
jgi:hypothetical protein